MAAQRGDFVLHTLAHVFDVSLRGLSSFADLATERGLAGSAILGALLECGEGAGFDPVDFGDGDVVGVSSVALAIGQAGGEGVEAAAPALARLRQFRARHR